MFQTRYNHNGRRGLIFSGDKVQAKQVEISIIRFGAKPYTEKQDIPRQLCRQPK